MTSSDTITSKGKVTSRIWDPVVRIGHWTLVFTFITAYITEGEAPVHMWAGYLLAAVVLFRLLWGFIGTRHARFSDFLCSPARIFAYLKSLLGRRPQHYRGHNPAGGVMILLLLLSLTLTAGSGMALYAVDEHAGPLAGAARLPGHPGLRHAGASRAPRPHRRGAVPPREPGSVDRDRGAAADADATDAGSANSDDHRRDPLAGSQPAGGRTRDRPRAGRTAYAR